MIVSPRALRTPQHRQSGPRAAHHLCPPREAPGSHAGLSLLSSTAQAHSAVTTHPTRADQTFKLQIPQEGAKKPTLILQLVPNPVNSPGEVLFISKKNHELMFLPVQLIRAAKPLFTVQGPGDCLQGISCYHI